MRERDRNMLRKRESAICTFVLALLLSQVSVIVPRVRRINVTTLVKTSEMNQHYNHHNNYHNYYEKQCVRNIPDFQEESTAGRITGDDVIHMDIPVPRNLHLVFIGDSLSRLMYLSLVHFLHFGTFIEPNDHPSTPAGVVDALEQRLWFQSSKEAKTTTTTTTTTSSCDDQTFHLEDGHFQQDPNRDNLFFWNPKQNNSIVFLSKEGHFDMQMSWSPESVHDDSPKVENNNTAAFTGQEADVIRHYLPKLQPRPTAVIINSGHWISHKLRLPHVQDEIVQALASVHMTGIYKTTTKRKDDNSTGPYQPYEQDLCDKMDYCLNLSWTGAVAQESYLPDHQLFFQQPIYKRMNLQLLRLLLQQQPQEEQQSNNRIVNDIVKDKTTKQMAQEEKTQPKTATTTIHHVPKATTSATSTSYLRTKRESFKDVSPQTTTTAPAPATTTMRRSYIIPDLDNQNQTIITGDDVLSTNIPIPRNLRLVFIGDSLSRFMYLSLVNFLTHGEWIQSTDFPNPTTLKDHTTRERFYNYTNTLLKPFEQCDCYTPSPDTTTTLDEQQILNRDNRYYWNPQQNNSVVFFSKQGHYDFQISWPPQSIHEEDRVVPQTKDPSEGAHFVGQEVDLIQNYLPKLQPRPQVVVMNNGHWESHKLKGPRAQEKVVQALHAVQMKGIYKTTTKRKEDHSIGRYKLYEENFCSKMDQCLNLSWTGAVSDDLYVDPIHFVEPIYKRMNIQLLRLLEESNHLSISQ